MVARTLPLCALLLAATAAVASPARAATLSEADLPSGAFGASFDRPAAVAAGYETVIGTGSQNRFDTMVFTDLAKGVQSIGFTFSAPASAGHSYSAGGAILFSETPFRYGWDGARLKQAIQVDYRNPKQSLTLDLADSFGGTLYLALNFTHGSDLAYSILAPGNAARIAPAPAPVPIPPALLLIGAAFGALGLVARRRRRSA